MHAKKFLSRLLLSVAAIAAALQCVRPEKNQSAPPVALGDFSPLPPPPAGVRHTFAAACYDCHSNHTRYPWYAEIQPFGWWLAAHVRDGKRELNFHELGTYNPKRLAKKLKAIASDVGERAMPLDSYTWTHRDAKLSPEQIAELTAWTEFAHAYTQARIAQDSAPARPLSSP